MLKSRNVLSLTLLPTFAVLLAAAPGIALQGEPLGEAQQAAQLMEVKGQPVLVFRVGHQHKTFPVFSWCFGNLYVSREAIRYEVTDAEGGGGAERYRNHGFAVPRAQVTGVERWYNGVEIRLARGKPYHLHLYSAAPGAPARGEFIQPEPLLEALTNFDAALARHQPPRPPAPTPPSAPPAPPPAVLTIVTQPGGAQVYLNDELKGTTDNEGVLVFSELPAGTYRLRLSLAGYQEWKREIKLELEEKRTLEVALLPVAPTPEGPAPLTLEQVVKLLAGGVAPARVTALVIERGVDFPLTNENEKRLRDAGATDALLLEIAKAKK